MGSENAKHVALGNVNHKVNSLLGFFCTNNFNCSCFVLPFLDLIVHCLELCFVTDVDLARKGTAFSLDAW